ncbi:MAG: nucleoside-diphosphate kinase [Chlamydia sp.]
MFTKNVKKNFILACIASSFFWSLLSTENGFATQYSSNSSAQVVSLESKPIPVSEIQFTFSMIKPVAVQDGHTGDILGQIERAGFQIVGLKMKTLTQDEVKRFYAEHASKPFFKGLIQKMSSGPVVMMVLKKSNGVAALREIVGATDPKKASTGTIRSIFGKNTTDNAIHASDGPASAAREISFFFSPEELIK